VIFVPRVPLGYSKSAGVGTDCAHMELFLHLLDPAPLPNN